MNGKREMGRERMFVWMGRKMMYIRGKGRARIYVGGDEGERM
jgi:hypothetical protein